MNATQKTIKYLAIAFAAFLAFSIIAGIGGAITGLTHAFTSKDSEETIDFSQTYDNVDSITIEGSIYNIKIQQGEEFIVDFDNVSENYKSSLKNGTLTLEYEGVGWGWFSWLAGEIKSEGSGKVTLTVPADFKAKNFKIDAGTGSIEFENISTSYLDIDAGTGSITGKTLTSDETDIDCGVGSVTLTNVSLNDTDVDCGTGNVRIGGTLLGENQINGGVGNIDLTLNGSTDDYNIEIDSGLGDVTINNEKYSDVNWNNNTADNSLDIDGGIGNVNIVFE